MKDAGSWILVILAVLGAVLPIIGGFVIYRLTRTFVTIKEYEAYVLAEEKRRVESDVRAETYRREMKEMVTNIDTKVMRILEIRIGEAAVNIAQQQHRRER